MQTSVDQLMQMALWNHQSGKLADAEKLYRQILVQNPNHPDALHRLGTLGAQIGQTAAAIDLLRRAIAMNPSAPDYHNDLGNALCDAKKLDDAASEFQEALKLKPDFVLAMVNLGNVLCDQGFLDDGIARYRRAIELKPDFAGAHCNLGKALRDQGALDEAVVSLREAIRLRNDYAEAHHNLSLCLLQKGDFAQGWPEHEWRLRLRHHAWIARDVRKPRWNGELLNGRTILIFCEQGMGDSIQFVRYLPLVAARGGKIILQCQPPLTRLFQTIAGVDQVVSANTALPAFDLHCPLLSLPHVFGTRLDSIPVSVPYLTAQWSARLAGSTRRKIGLVWAGSRGFANDRNRSLQLATLSPLANLDRVELHSIQKGDAAAQLSNRPAGMVVLDHAANLNDFADTAALIANLDLVISVDTAVAHLAGAMGKSVWLLLPRVPDWRWLQTGDTSPWYPTMRLFRQAIAGDWNEVVARVALALDKDS